MANRNAEQARERNARTAGGSNSAPAGEDDYGLHGPERRLYRGKESYEQQSRGGEGGRSGMWDHRQVPRDIDERYSNNADEDQRGYQDIGQRAEFETATHRDPRAHAGIEDDDDDDDARFGFDARDYHQRH